MHFLSILRIVGILVMCFSCTMLLPAFVALLYGDGGGKAFIQSFVMSAIAGVILWWACHHHKEELRSREGFLIVVAFWVVMGSLGAIPFMLFEDPDLTVSSAFFESFSGLTTTGATTIVGLDNLPKAILFYRQLLQWLGGMGIIVLAVAIIPLFGIGGMSLYRAEISGPLKENKMRPRITETAKTLWIIYASLTLLCAFSYWLAGMSPFDAISHSFSTVSIGGFSTHDRSMAYFASSTVNIITVVFLLISACNYVLHFNAFSQLGKRNIFLSYFRDPEFRFFMLIQFSLVLICFAMLLANHHFDETFQNLEQALFQSVSISTTAGYTTSSFEQWPLFLPILLLFASCIGGCAGSTGGGLKVVRVLVLYLQAKRELKRLIHPNLVYPIKLGKRVLDERVIQSIWAFFSAYLLVFVICLLGVISCGVETFDAFNAVIACLNNVGPALGAVSSNFVGIPDSAKWILTLAMVCGRLEIFSLLVLFTPAFWKS
ncbi:potassium transporter [Aggregatibacter actinomycetemcomitans]|uniref:Trk system potassium uptake protein n=3 Tax=Aggregatibacter actinomycetemcomitans TaxID=714 RepID=A0A2G1DML4_AGGAC|nr:TrkH family potassium uptake protein [Aggregatibacter actinomycetemcomitans]KYK95320.1 potassium transporter [Aggregatibacter actinomycetemcomitans serotype d str. SA3733]ANU81739.1 potassium transporter [Aggregatibacter actinomycetemcomitans]KND85910.1 potassium transporter [Aggregatibacter actinomycetemcomitans serotype a str. H5P1]KOE30387.1 potassium transporter [Aggregatibacter actinomycetemcomitans D17P-3]KOE68026.1 potassium transporter [Aggregatibacter actinomycetemcomitans serotype